MVNAETSRFQAVPRRRLADEVADQIERLIVTHELNMGDALPPQRELASEMGVSRNILREAISKLVQKGLLEVHSGSGTYVAQPSVEFLRDTLSFFLHFNNSAFSDLIEARRCLEVEIAREAAKRATAESCQNVLACLELMEGALGDLELYVEADVRFHEALAKAAGNKILELLLSSIRGALRENIRLLLKHHPNAQSEAMQWHRRIAQAVQRHEPEAASLAMLEHINSVARGLREVQAQNTVSPEDEA
jgi:GntR family transcriptional repressor for pyruvate dehydrogenase complex